MKEAIISRVKELLARKEIDGFLALREQDGGICPYLFTDPHELGGLNLGDRNQAGDARYPLVKLLCQLAEKHPTKTLGILVRGCDERALDVLYSDGRVRPLNAAKVVPVGFSCPPELAAACQCVKPWPDALVAGERTPGAAPPEEPGEDLTGQLGDWFAVFDRCVKCFGCRNICPVCECKECTVEEESHVPQRELPINPNFLMTRAMHMVDRCVYCGLCETACPADIPLKGLYRLMSRVTGFARGLPGAPRLVMAPQDRRVN